MVALWMIFLFTDNFLEDIPLHSGEYYLSTITDRMNIPSRIQNIIKEKNFFLH